ncbi:hypothetical protein ACFV0B_26895 [Streptomyces xanthophaeus]|uniref:hypothetical protein n=1 Tax=Streptomyces xanthophaeus TaxID=67385 RepID=UPI00367A187F
MLELSNLGWPQTPYGSTGQIIQRPRRLLTGLTTLWADDHGPVLMSAAAVFIPVHRTRPVPVVHGPFNFGYRVLAATTTKETPEILAALDVLLVQARRDAHAIAWHNAEDDLYSMSILNPDQQGVAGVTAAWTARNRTPRAKGIARCVDTAQDLGPAELLADTAAANGLNLGRLFPVQDQDNVQSAFEELTENGDDPYIRDVVAQNCAGGALTQALTVALLGGKHLGHLEWEEPPQVSKELELIAWDRLPVLFPTVSEA